MDLYIRSQDREDLIKINHRLFIVNDKNAYAIKVDLCTDDGFVLLGIYATIERALEVLDEIHNILKPKGILKFGGLIPEKELAKIKEKLNDEYLVFNQNVELIQQPATYVYEMPLE